MKSIILTTKESLQIIIVSNDFEGLQGIRPILKLQSEKSRFSERKDNGI